jgi:hypothetical protein
MNPIYNVWPPGHYYSPIPNLEELKKNENKIFNSADPLKGIELNLKNQTALFNEFKEYYPDLPWHDNKNNNKRYYYLNDFYSYGDAIILYSMIRHLKPKNIIEVGSGFSSALIIDTNETFFNNSISCTFIEPYPERFLSLIKEKDLENVTLIQENLEEIDLNIFSKLSAGDILFIDSSHISKVNSDVNFIIFKLLPSLNPGVHIHFHDIFYPFEYPKEWIYKGIFWNEAYILRAFLQFNNTFRIEYFSSYFHKQFHSLIMKDMPLITKNIGGSIWITKTCTSE